MSETKRLSERNSQIADMLADGNALKNFYRFTAQNPHIDLHDACQIMIARPDASLCFTFEEWNAMGRRVTQGRKGIPYYDRDGYKMFVFDARDTHGDSRYRRSILPMKRLLAGLEELDGKYGNVYGLRDYDKIRTGVASYLRDGGLLVGYEQDSRHIIEGIAYSLYCKTGFPKDSGIDIKGLPYDLNGNAQLFKSINGIAEKLVQELEDALLRKRQEPPVIDDTEEDAVSDEPIIAQRDAQFEAIIESPASFTPDAEPTVIKPDETDSAPQSNVSALYRKYLEAQKSYPDAVVLLRLGDFYEVMGENAVTVASELDLILTGRDVGLSERMPMCGFPYHVTDGYLEKILVKHSVLIVEDGQTPKYILSHSEALKPREDEPSPSESSAITEEIIPDEQPDNADELADLSEEDIADTEQSDDGEEKDEKTESLPQAKKSNPLSQRRRKPKPQPSLFDILDGNTAIRQTPEEQLIEYALKRGSMVEDSKFRIYDKYKRDPTVGEFAAFLKNEYGWSGGCNREEEWNSDGKGLKFTRYDKVNRANNVTIQLKWAEVANEIADLIDDNNYFTSTEQIQYDALQKRRSDRINAVTDEEKLHVIARQFIEEAANKTWNGTGELIPFGFEESCEYIKEHRTALECALLAEKEVKSLTPTPAGYEYLYKDNIYVEFYPEYCPRLHTEEKTVETTVVESKGEYFGLTDTVSTTALSDYANTDLAAVGLDQNDLGGAKQRYRNNVAAIRLTNTLYAEDRNPYPEEKKALAKYVGWGGLAQVFDEHNAQWQNEYVELKSLLSPEDYMQARGSVLNAHYTPQEVIAGVYKALARFGVKSNNRILEPAMGTGNFFGYMPKEISDGARLYGVELDNLTGRIAAKLYPQVNVQIRGYEETSFPDNCFDLVVSNVPFGGYGVHDSEYNRYKFLIHDYFIAKSIDKVRPDGIVAVITSKGTMDKLNPSVRKYLADRAELLGSIRLPNTAFKKTANTEAVTDILFFRKRQAQINATPAQTEWLSTGKTDEGFEINNYFIRHPEMVLGTLAEEHGLYGAIDVTVKPDGRELSAALSEAVERLPAAFYENPAEPYSVDEEIEVDYDVKPLNYKAENGRLFIRVGDHMAEQVIPSSPKDAYERIRGMIGLRTQLRHILDVQTNGCSDGQLAAEQRDLGAKYDAFVKRFGFINSQTNARLFREDGDSALLFACEELSEDKKTAKKADVFTKRTIQTYTSVTSTDDCFEAMQICKNEHGRLDIAYIEELTKKDYDTVLAELDTTVFRNPDTVDPADKYSGFETAEEYLAGNVVRKLQTAQAYAERYPHAGYGKNVVALMAVQPEPLTAADISVRLGAHWVDNKYYTDFLCRMLGVPYYYTDGVEIYHNPHDSSWRVDKTDYVRNCVKMNATEVYGTSRANAFRLFEDCLNLRATNIYDTVEIDGEDKRVLNQAETIAAREKQNKMKEAFRDWIFTDPKRRADLEATYNRLFNQTRLPAYDGSYLKFPEMNPAIELKPHQKNAVHRIITGGNTLLHHVVGAGKTYTMAAAIMKLRQYGLAKKPMIAVPNHLVEQWAGEFRTLYPNAKLLIAGKEDLTRENRQRFVSKVALGDWDAVIIAQSSFAKIPISKERQVNKISEEIARIDESISAQWENSSFPKGTVKSLERIKKGRETLLKRLLDDTDKDNVLKFEDLGVDYLFIDEAHYYKNKFLFTKMNNVAGISTAASQRASDLELKIEYINEQQDGDKGVVFATGTPISNTMAEMYTMQSYLSKRTLEEAGLTFFDSWAADFGETITSLELAPSGQGYKPRTRFAKFTNLPELQKMYRMFADVQSADMVKLNVPTAERRIVTLKPSDTVIELAEKIAERAERISRGGVKPHIDNMLKVTSDGKKLALDARCFDPMVGDEPGNKVTACAENVNAIWEETAAERSTQIVFCDLSTPKKSFDEYEYGKDFDVYNELKYKLTQMGIPAGEIAFIHEANSDKQKQDLFKNVNDGKVRVLIGSTEKCGAGTNIQKRLTALHHLDTPYRPSDMEQREGRIIRQGNTNQTVRIFTYVTERTFDSYSYQILEVKQNFISQITRGDLTAREIDDIDETTLSYAEIKAITAANPRIKRKMEVDSEVAKLRILEGQYKKNLYSLQDKVLKTLPEQIRKQTLFIERLTADMQMAKAKFNPEAFVINVNGQTYTDRKDGAKALTEAIYSSKPDTVVAEYCGFKISLNPLVMLTGERSVTLTGTGQYVLDIGQSSSGNLTRLDNFIADFPNKEVRAKDKLMQLERDLEIAKTQLDVPFEHKEQMTELLKEQAELNAELDLNRREEIVIEDNEDNESNGEVYAALPNKPQETAGGRKRRRPIDRRKLSMYDAQHAKNPDAYIFVKNGERYELYGGKAEQYAAAHGLTLLTDKFGDETVAVLSLESDVLDKTIEELVNNGKQVEIMETLGAKKEERIINNEDKTAAMTVDLLPDYTVSREEMHDYGYTWDGMLPLKSRAAKRLWGIGLQVYALHPDDTETEITNFEQFGSNGIYGIEKPVWNNYLSQKETDAYFAARMYVANAAGKIINKELDYVDAMYADPLSDINFVERAALTRYLRDKEMPDAEKMKPYLPDLLTEYSDFIAHMPLEYYGWDTEGVKHSIANNIEHDEMKSYAKELTKINYDIDGEYDNMLPKMSDAETQSPDLSAVDNVLTVVGMDYMILVRDSVKREFSNFETELLKKPVAEVINDNYRIHVFTELRDVINEEDYLTAAHYRALYEDDGHILQSLYEDFIGNEYASLNNYYETANYIKSYNENRHADVLKAEELRELAEQTVYFGKDANGAAYYYFTDKLSNDALTAVKEIAGNYVIAAPVCYISEEDREKKHIEFLKVGRDITAEELSDERIAIDKMLAAVNRAAKAPVYYKSWDYAVNHDENIPYIESNRISGNCIRAIEAAIAANYKDNTLVTGFEDGIVEKYGYERVAYVLATFIRNNGHDGRYSKENREWANGITLSESDEVRKGIYLNEHPGLLDLFARRIRLMAKEQKKEQEQMQEFNYLTETAQGYKVIDMIADKFGRNIVIAQRDKDYVVGAGYDTRDGRWAQGIYDFPTFEAAENYREENYGMTEENTEADKIIVNLPAEAIIERYRKHCFMKMPQGEYAGYTYNVSIDRIQPDGSDELSLELVLYTDSTVKLANREGDKVELSPMEFAELVNNTTAEDYIDRRNWFKVSLPNEAMRGMYKHASLFVLPNTVVGETYAFYLPNSFVEEDVEREDGRLIISLPADFTVRARDRKDVSNIELTAQEFYDRCNGTTAEDYIFGKESETPSKTESAENGLQRVSVDKSAKIAAYKSRTLFKMPKGERENFCYYLPNTLLKSNEKTGEITVSLPMDFIVKLKDNKNDVAIELTREEYINAVAKKCAEDYEYIRRPSEAEVKAFAETEKRLRNNVPEEMLSRPNWCIVRTKYNAEKQRPEKFLIDCHTGKFAHSDDPATWTDFKSACAYARENGGIALAYALDGTDKIACIDLDKCIDGNGGFSKLASSIFPLAKNTYAETSLSGQGLHFFGKTDGMDVRTFSKTGDMEFYQKAHFIALTGESFGSRELMSFDEPQLKKLIEAKCEKRTDWHGTGKGVDGLSVMSDRDVVDKACAAKHGDTFKALYEGQDLQNNHSNSDMSLMNRLAFWCNGDKEQMLRIFATSGLYRQDKSPAYYEGTAIKAVRDTTERFQPRTQTAAKPVKNGAGKDGKK